MKVKMTPTGVQSIDFVDQAGARGVLKQTSGRDYGNPTWDQPNSSYVLLGVKDAPLKLNMDQVAELVEYLQTWLETGALSDATALQEMKKTA
ncbi:MAG: hypothetical protein U0793_30685 [Gemmataceae bacterium]